MAKATPPINSFSGGEVYADLLDFRFEFDKYRSSCRTLQNALPLVEGGARKLPGTYYVGTTKTNQIARLAKFSFNTDQNYVVEFTDSLIRILTEDGIVQTVVGEHDDYDAPTAYTTGNKVLIGEYWASGFAGSKILYICSPYGEYIDPLHRVDDFFILGLNSSDNLAVSIIGNQIIVALADTTGSKNTAALIQVAIRALGAVGSTDLSAFTVTANATYAGAPPTTASTSRGYEDEDQGVWVALQNNQHTYFPPSEAAYWEAGTADDEGDVEIVSPYAEADLFALDVSTQIEDTLYIFHPEYRPRVLLRQASGNWSLTTFDVVGTPEPSKYGEDFPVKTISGVTAASPPVVTSFGHGFNTGDTVYIAGIVGMIELNRFVFTVTKVDEDSYQLAGEDSTSYTAYASGGYAIKVYDIFNGENKYPACGTIFEQRLVVGGSNDYPQRIYGSVAGNHALFINDPEADDYGYVYDLKSNQNNRLRWLRGHNSLMCGSSGGIKSVHGSSEEPLTQSNISTREATTIGTSKVSPELVNDTLLWLTRSKEILRMAEYSIQSDKWVSPDLTRLARHITKGTTLATSGIKQMAFMGDPYPVLWALRNDGVLLGLTYEATEQIFAWFRFVTDGTIESIACISNDDNEDRLWMSVQRTISESTVRYLEYMKPFEIYSTLEDAFFVHSGLTYDSTPATTISGLDHLEGEALDVLADGISVGPLTVSSGDITLTTAASKVHAGLPYDTIIEPLPPHVGLISGTSKTKKQVCNRVALALYESVGGTIGDDASKPLNISSYDDDYSDADDDAPALFTGEVDNIAIFRGWDNDCNLYIKHSVPVPFTVKAIIPDVFVNEYGR